MESGFSIIRASRRFLAAVFLLGSLFFPQTGFAQAADRLDIIVYGASGRVGSRVVDEALQRGHQVTAVSRDPSGIERRHAKLVAVKGDVLDPASVAALVAGQDVVVVAVRGSVGGSEKPEDTVHRRAVEVIVGVLREQGDNAPRLIFVGGAGSLEVEPGVTYWESLSSFSKTFIPDFLLQEIQGHLLVLDYLRQVDDVRWTYLSPPRTFKPGERSGNYRTGGDTMLEDARGNSAISMEDYAVALVDEAENGAFIGQRFTVVQQVDVDRPSTTPISSEK
jgi:hypothetical protein